MELKDKLYTLRREKGLSQEQFASALEVSRQAVSKWETGQVIPEVSKLIQISDLFGVSLDYLLKDTVTTSTANTENVDAAIETGKIIERFLVYEYKSKKTLFGLPLVHIVLTNGFKIKPAHGIIAIGNVACGVVSIGALSLGGISFGALSLGLLSIGAVSLGLMAFGAVAIGLISIGAVAICQYGLGAAVIANKAGVGAAVNSKVAAGVSANGEATLFLTEETTRSQVRDFLVTNCPKIPHFVLNILTLTCRK